MTAEALSLRRMIWLALSDLYLDTELDSSTFDRISVAIRGAGFSLQEAKAIDYFEVAPLIGWNLLSTAGIWNGFDPWWLYRNCEINYTRQRDFIHRVKCHLINGLIYNTRRNNWQHLTKAIKKASATSK